MHTCCQQALYLWLTKGIPMQFSSENLRAMDGDGDVPHCLAAGSTSTTGPLTEMATRHGSAHDDWAVLLADEFRLRSCRRCRPERPPEMIARPARVPLSIGNKPNCGLDGCGARPRGFQLGCGDGMGWTREGTTNAGKNWRH